MKIQHFYKNQIKTIGAQIKLVKPASRKLQSLWSRNLSESPEAEALRKIIYAHPSVESLRHQARYLNLAYALIREKDISKVETNPRTPHDPQVLQKIMDQMAKDFKIQVNAEVVEVANETTN